MGVPRALVVRVGVCRYKLPSAQKVTLSAARSAPMAVMLQPDQCFILMCPCRSSARCYTVVVGPQINVTAQVENKAGLDDYDDV